MRDPSVLFPEKFSGLFYFDVFKAHHPREPLKGFGACGYGLALPALDYLYPVLQVPEELIGLLERIFFVLFYIFSRKERGEGLEGVPLPYCSVLSRVYELQSLAEELYLPYAARAELDVDGVRVPAQEAQVYLLLHGLYFFYCRKVQVLPEDK